MQPRDPSDRVDQPTLNLDLEPDSAGDVDAPIPFQLTGSGRRAVATDPSPGLHAVAAEDTDLPDPADPRRARARALRRAGRSVEDIAASLDLDLEIVAHWTAGLRSRRARRHLRPVRSGPSTVAEGDAFDAMAASAYQEARARLTSRQFVRGAALVAGAAELSRHGVLLGVTDEATARRIVAFLRGAAETDPGRIRIILRRVDASPDLAAHRWAETLGLPRTQVSVGRGDATTGHAALVRVACPDTAARLLGWRRALLETDDLDLDSLGLAY